MSTVQNNTNMLNIKTFSPMNVQPTKPVAAPTKENAAKRLHSTSSHASSGVSSAGHSSHDRNSSRTNPSHDSDNSSQQNMRGTSKSSDEGIQENKVPAALPEGFAEDRFRVDRKRLESLLSQSIKMVNNNNNKDKEGEKTESSSQQNIKPLTRAEAFFLEVMNTTNTQVSWPSRLKVGAKSKKDPHIKITGPIEQVKIAKEMIMKQLDSKSSRVTIKMDVSHTDHSHVIGKGGSNIKHVMKETECHIHFPDSNRNQNVTEKSNQVSIAGQAAGVELARQRIRDLLPITLFFEFPSKHLGATGFDINSPAVQNIVQTYNISIQAKAKKSSPYTTIFQIRGCVANQIALKDGVICLMQILTGQLGQTIPVSATLEIQNVQSFMNAKSVSKIKAIQANTGVTIEFPTDKKSSTIEAITAQCEKVVAMTGSCEGVLFARQEIISHLPLVLMFDLKDEVSNHEAQSIGDKFECFISIKAKNKQATKSCIIKSSEANVYNMFKARQALMKIPFNGLEDIPMPINTASFLFTQKIQTVAGLQAAAMVQAQKNQVAQVAAQAAVMQQQNNFVPNWKPATPTRKMQIQAKSINSARNSSTPSSDSANGSTSTRSVESTSKISISTSNIIRQPNGPSNNRSFTTVRNNSTKTGIKIASIQSTSVNGSRQGSCHSSDDACNTSDISDGEHQRVSSKPIVSESHINMQHPTFNGRHIIVNSINKSATNNNNVTNACFTTNNLTDNSSEQVTCKNNLFAPNNNNNNSANKYVTTIPKNLSSLFSQLSLDKYTQSFLEQEIDLQTFVTMSDNDLREMGVNTFGARRKMSMAIKELSGNKISHVSSANISLKIGK